MAATLLALLPLMLSAAIAPSWIVIQLLLLRRPGGIAAAVAFVAGMTFTRLAQGALFGFSLVTFGRGDSATVRTLTSTVMLLLGILMLVTAVRKLLYVPDPDGPPPSWVKHISGMSPLLAFALSTGSLIISGKQWVFTLAALGIIREGELRRPEATIAYLIYVLAAQVLLLLPLLGMIVARERTTTLLDDAMAWLKANERAIMVTVSVVFGVLFLSKGITGLR